MGVRGRVDTNGIIVKIVLAGAVETFIKKSTKLLEMERLFGKRRTVMPRRVEIMPSGPSSKTEKVEINSQPIKKPAYPEPRGGAFQ